MIVSSLLFACGTTAKLDEKLVYKQRYFFRPGADYYSRINLQTLRPLMRALMKDLPRSQRLQMQMIVERTNLLLAYRMNIYLYSLLEGSFPKNIIDNLLTRHPEWLPLEEEVDGFRHYSASLEIGLPETNIVYATTENLKAAYAAPVVPVENILPAYVISAMEKNPFVVYHPKGNPLFIKDNPDFSRLPDFQLLLTMAPLDGKLYRVEAEFIVINPQDMGNFPAQLQAVIDWYKTYYPDWASMLDALSMNVHARQVVFSGIYSLDDIVSASADAIRIAVTNFENSRYLSDSVQQETAPTDNPE